MLLDKRLQGHVQLLAALGVERGDQIGDVNLGLAQLGLGTAGLLVLHHDTADCLSCLSLGHGHLADNGEVPLVLVVHIPLAHTGVLEVPVVHISHELHHSAAAVDVQVLGELGLHLDDVVGMVTRLEGGHDEALIGLRTALDVGVEQGQKAQAHDGVSGQAYDCLAVSHVLEVGAHAEHHLEGDALTLGDSRHLAVQLVDVGLQHEVVVVVLQPLNGVLGKRIEEVLASVQDVCTAGVRHEVVADGGANHELEAGQHIRILLGAVHGAVHHDFGGVGVHIQSRDNLIESGVGLLDGHTLVPGVHSLESLQCVPYLAGSEVSCCVHNMSSYYIVVLI